MWKYMNYERTCLPPNNFLRPSRRSLKVSCFASTFLKTRFLSKDKLHSYSYILGITNIHMKVMENKLINGHALRSPPRYFPRITLLHREY